MDETTSAVHPLVGKDDTPAGIVVISAATGAGVSYQVPTRSSPVQVVENLKNGGAAPTAGVAASLVVK